MGPFRGTNEFYLRPESDETPIILFGGKNGAGKTTIFQSVPIAIYGQGWDRRQTKKEYQQTLTSLVHDAPGADGRNQAKIEVEFEYGHLGEDQLYRVVRDWDISGSSVTQDLTIYRDGQILEEVEEDHWREFLRELVPPGVSDLFFFDGERIRELAGEGDINTSAVRDALNSLLGLDTISRLEGDLRTLMTRKSKETGSEEIRSNIEEAEARLSELSEHRSELVDKLEDHKQQLESAQAEQGRVEQKIAEKGGRYARKRDEHRETRTEIESEIELVENQLRDLARSVLPIALAPTVSDKLYQQLEMEEDHKQWQAAQDVLNSKKKDLQEDIKEAISSGDEIEDSLEDRIESVVEENLVVPPPEGVKEAGITHPLGDRERSRVLTWIEQAFRDEREETLELAEELDELYEERERVEEKLARAPDESDVAPLVDRSQELSEELGEHRAAISNIEQELEVIDNKITRTENSLESLYDEAKEVKEEAQTLELAGDVREALQSYQSQLTTKKLQELNETLTECFSVLSNKPEFYKRVEINENIEPTIHTQGDGVRRGNQISAGERQIFATALLWALARTSGRELPFIIDSPLGRLDSEHRTNIVEKFFPQASSQVIILSTDTEVDREYFGDLEPHISRSFHLQHNEKSGHTSVEEGYFWEQPN